MLEYAAKTWEASGFKRYEISAFAKQEKYQSQHNLGYWTGRLFLGLGPSAYGYMNGERMQNSFPLKRYAKTLREGNDPAHFREQLQYPNNMRELLAIHLRIRKGVALERFRQKHGIDEETEKTIQSLIKRGWLEQSGKYLRLTEEGMLFYDSVAVELI